MEVVDTDTESLVVPARLFDYDFDLAMTSCVVEISDADMVKPSRYTVIDVSVTPEMWLAVKEISKRYDMKQRTCLSTLMKFSLAVFEHKYTRGLKNLKNNRTDGFFGGKFAATVKLYGECSHFFGKVKGGRKRFQILCNKNSIAAPVSDFADYYNLSKADMVQIILCHGIELWQDLPKDAVYYSNVVKKFGEHDARFSMDSKLEDAEVGDVDDEV